MPTHTKKIRLGICMAGAVSAGAYTAGVMDYLIEALERWEQLKKEERRRARGKPGYPYRIPMHEMEIVILGGASAGGMTAAITARALAEAIEHVTPDKREKYKNARHGAGELNNLLYESWVKLTDPDMLARLLDTGDLRQYRSVLSLLNAGFKDTLADRILLRNPLRNPLRRPYVNEQLDLLLTLSNFNGVTVRYPFRSAGERETFFSAKLHQDFAHFSAGGSEALQGRIHLDFRTNANAGILAAAAKATGAFPLGFEARFVERPAAVLAQNRFLRERWGQLPEALDPHNPNRPDTVVTLNADGGTLNNEPFELVQAVMDQRFPPGDAAGAFNILLMIDPFPDNEPGDDDLQAPRRRSLPELIPRLLNAILHQGRAKPRDIQTACGDDLRRFIMAPSRKSPGKPDIEGSRAIACGALAGFSGFLDERFREHDFFLGRKNCQRFLQKYFTAPADFFDPEVCPDTAKTALNIAAGDHLPLLPDLGPDGRLMAPEQPPAYPAYDLNNLKRYRMMVLSRSWHILRLLFNFKFRHIALILACGLIALPVTLLAAFLVPRWYWRQLRRIISKELKTWGLLKK